MLTHWILDSNVQHTISQHITSLDTIMLCAQPKKNIRHVASVIELLLSSPQHMYHKKTNIRVQFVFNINFSVIWDTFCLLIQSRKKYESSKHLLKALRIWGSRPREIATITLKLTANLRINLTLNYFNPEWNLFSKTLAFSHGHSVTPQFHAKMVNDLRIKI